MQSGFPHEGADSIAIQAAKPIRDAVLPPPEVTLLAEAGTKVAFCPSTSLELAKGATSIGMHPEMIDRGVAVGLGTDGVSASGNMNMHRQMYLAAGLFKDSRMDPTLDGATQALRMATIEGAALLGWEDKIGSLEEGQKADFLLWDLDDAEWTPYSDPIQALVWSVSTRSLAETWVDGECLFRGGDVAGIDERSRRAKRDPGQRGCAATQALISPRSRPPHRYTTDTRARQAVDASAAKVKTPRSTRSRLTS